jgi:hypothetical protein
MTHSLIGADRGTHRKIVATALAGAALVALVGFFARQGAPDGATARLEAGVGVLRAGKPALAASLDIVAVR